MHQLSIQSPKSGLKIENFAIAVDELDAGFGCKEGDKIAAWPYWIQGYEIPNCPKCQEAAKLVFQIDSGKNLSIIFGDMGIVHLTRCPEYKEVFALVCACS